MSVQPSYYFRVLRLRWKALAGFALAGALLAAGFTAMSARGDDEVVITHYLATHKLILSEEAISASFYPNLLQSALQVTGDEIPAAVGEALDRDPEDLVRRIRTVTDTELNKIEISAVATDPEQAALIADSFAAHLVDHMSRRELAAYEAVVAEVQVEVDRSTEALAVLDSSIRELKLRQISLVDERDDSAAAERLADREGTDLPDGVRTVVAVSADLSDVADELQKLESQRSSRSSLLESALADLDQLETDGAPVDKLETLDIVPPFVISEGEYNSRLAQGRRGENNFSSRDVPATSSGGIALGDTVSNPVVRVLIGLIAGLLLGVGAVLLHMKFDPRLRTKADVEESFDLPVLAEIPAFSKRDKKTVELHAITRTRSSVTEAYRMVRSALVFAKATAEAPLVIDATTGEHARLGPEAGELPASARAVAEAVGHEMRVVMITSPGPSEGKTTTTANLAVVLAESGYEVLVVNCDYRLPKLHKFFGLPHQPRRTLRTGIPGVTLIAGVVPPGEVNPTQVVEAQRDVINRARKRFDVILLDTAPLLATNDAVGLLPVVDLVVLVAAEGRTDREAATETVDLLRRRRANLAGVVLTCATGFGRSRYYHTYRYGNYYDREAELGTTVKQPPPPRSTEPTSDPSEYGPIPHATVGTSSRN